MDAGSVGRAKAAVARAEDRLFRAQSLEDRAWEAVDDAPPGEAKGRAQKFAIRATERRFTEQVRLGIAQQRARMAAMQPGDVIQIGGAA